MTERTTTRIFFSAGEPSGDLHGANLIRELKRRDPAIEAVGFGGPEMQRAGCDLHEDLTRLAVMWLLRVLANLHTFFLLAFRADRYFRQHRPDAVVLIDYPGFNWWIAWRAKLQGIPVFYFAPPQIWAWASWRIVKMRRYVDHVLCALPFEARWFAERGCRARFVGHPFFDEVRRQRLDASFLQKHGDPSRPLVTLLPGSRTQEVKDNLAHFLKTATAVQAGRPEVRFAVAAFKPAHAKLAKTMIQQAGLEIEVFARRTPELIHLADCCLAVSGSVSLELLHAAKPTVILYTISPLAFWVQKQFRRARYITLVNLLATERPFLADAEAPNEAQTRLAATQALFPEFLTCEDRSQEIAQQLVDWLANSERRAALTARLERLRDIVGHGGAASKAAEYLLDQMNRRPVRLLQPHFLPGPAWTGRGSRPATPRAMRKAA